jgi:hypothetical protein
MSRRHLAPKPAYADYQIVVGWDRPLGTYYAQVINFDNEPDPPAQSTRTAAALRRLAALLPLPARWRPAEPVFIWLGIDGIVISNPPTSSEPSHRTR